MSDLILHNWLEVNHYMRDDYRLLVSAMAARALKTADPELRTLAQTAFGSIPVKGARSFAKGDIVQQRLALAKAMQTSPQVASLVIALWSFAAESHLALLTEAAVKAGLQFAEGWDWHKGMEGFYDFESIALLSALADGLGAHMDEKDYDHLKLAALWLGPAVSNPEAFTNVPEELKQEHEHEHDDEHEHEHNHAHEHEPTPAETPTDSSS